jgi:hypothetical protein
MILYQQQEEVKKQLETSEKVRLLRRLPRSSTPPVNPSVRMGQGFLRGLVGFSDVST